MSLIVARRIPLGSGRPTDDDGEAIVRVRAWRRFWRNRPAVLAAAVLVLLHAVALVPDFFATARPLDGAAERSEMPPQPIRLFRSGRLAPHTLEMRRTRDPATFRVAYAPDPEHAHAVALLGRGYEYEILGLVRSDRHLLAVGDGAEGATLALLGTDLLGRDQWSRIAHGARASLLAGALAVVVVLAIGATLGAVGGYLGGRVDALVVLLCDFVGALPTVPIWVGVAAMMPRGMDPIRLFVAVATLVALIGWGELARGVRARVRGLRAAAFVEAAAALGCGRRRVIGRHILPHLTGHLVVATTGAIPAMIAAETTLSFVGVGLRAPVISWGTLLQSAQNVQTLLFAPWLLAPAVPVVAAIVAFHLVGDALRDALAVERAGAAN
jgi:peptide/nickel transport system permease protein